MSHNKRQHYVPQFYLRNFSSLPSRKSISLYEFRGQSFIANASIRGQCQRDFYYGDDLGVEKGLGILEGAFADVVSRVCRGEALSATQKRFLALFIVVQRGRTAASERSMIGWIEYIERMDWTPEARAQFLGDITEIKKSVPAENVRTSARAAPMVYDLKAVIIECDRKPWFITSDNPVVSANPVWPIIRGHGGFGLSSAGLILFLPLSPCRGFMLYDGGCYTLDKCSNRKAKATAHDMAMLNGWSVKNCDQILYFPETLAKDTIDKLIKDNEAQRLSHEAIIREYEEVEPGVFRRQAPSSTADTGSTLMHTHSKGIEQPLNLSFLKRRSKLVYQKSETARGPLRSSGWSDLAEALLYDDAPLPARIATLKSYRGELPREVMAYLY